MKTIFERIWKLAKPYLDVRNNNIHTEIATKYAYKLLMIEKGDEDIIIPSIILHDVGWKNISEELHLKSFGPNGKEELTKQHEKESVKIAKKILKEVNYDKIKTQQILKIIEGHDSKKEAISLNDKLVKDADKLWRFSKEGFTIDCKRFKQTTNERVKAKDTNIALLFTDSAKQIAGEEIKNRLKESKVSQD
ncbi:MAG: HD domain-containing protein [Candidatus Aenigmarchaeota archaeon]|nr:HD domain-containing protein [Candidatus Aenigmarchaeota archaeon]